MKLQTVAPMFGASFNHRRITMKKLALRLLGLTLVVTALGTAVPKPAQAQACNLLCAQGLRCCIAADGSAYCAKHC